MTMEGFKLDAFDVVIHIANVVDIMCPAVGQHHMQVAYLSYQLGTELGYSRAEKHELAMAAALHDIGAFSLRERLDLLEFEDKEPGKHSLAGYLLLREFVPFQSIAEVVRFHHTPWRQGKGAKQNGKAVPMESHLIHLADRVAVKIDKNQFVLDQVDKISQKVQKASDKVFVPEHVEALARLAKKDFIWMDLASDSIGQIVRRTVGSSSMEIGMEDLLALSKMISKLIDFKSEFTATHSKGVAATAVALAGMMGFPRREKALMEIAAYLHDLGKLAVSNEIIDKPGSLTDEEWSIMRSHAYFTHQTLVPLVVLNLVADWAALHQERLDGSGYPFGLGKDELSLGARIMAVADIFAALTENRPYRVGMDKNQATEVLQDMKAKDQLDHHLVDTVLENYDNIDKIRRVAQLRAGREYKEFQAMLSQEMH
jgi:HD-GYP domain-containing protein (c-di-GMP phosphodiesterase class II)